MLLQCNNLVNSRVLPASNKRGKCSYALGACIAFNLSSHPLPMTLYLHKQNCHACLNSSSKPCTAHQVRKQMGESRAYQHACVCVTAGSGSLDALPRGSMELEASEDNVPGRSWTLLLSDSRGSGCTTSGTSPFTR